MQDWFALLIHMFFSYMLLFVHARIRPAGHMAVQLWDPQCGCVICTSSVHQQTFMFWILQMFNRVPINKTNLSEFGLFLAYTYVWLRQDVTAALVCLSTLLHSGVFQHESTNMFICRKRYVLDPLCAWLAVVLEGSLSFSPLNSRFLVPCSGDA